MEMAERWWAVLATHQDPGVEELSQPRDLEANRAPDCGPL